MRLATWNVNSIIARLPHVIRWLEAIQPDVLCMQETKCTDDKFPFDEFSKIGYCASVFGQQSYNGVAIIARHECAEVQRGNYEDQEGAHARLLAATLDGVRIVNVYIPNGQAVGSEKFEFKLDWMKRLRAFFDNNFDIGAPVILCGDFNVAPEDRDVHNPQLWQERIMC
ncbi:MAG TPA: exodeoxyribonuclease III, partial [Pyrinomonadaceae bacterium]|nr:exodeoxyribonuclease III [Pyrinomonadaceae bacterium]